jgi:hypothetical protein
MENLRISLNDPEVQADWHLEIEIKIRLDSAEEHCRQIRKIMLEWKKKHGLTYTGE